MFPGSQDIHKLCLMDAKKSCVTVTRQGTQDSGPWSNGSQSILVKEGVHKEYRNDRTNLKRISKFLLYISGYPRMSYVWARTNLRGKTATPHKGQHTARTQGKAAHGDAKTGCPLTVRLSRSLSDGRSRVY